MHQPAPYPTYTARASRRELAEAAMRSTPGPARQQAIQQYLASHHYSDKAVWTLVCAAITTTPKDWETFAAEDLMGAGLPVTTLAESLETSLTAQHNWLKSGPLRSAAQSMKEVARLRLIQKEHESIMPGWERQPETAVAFAYAYGNLAETLVERRRELAAEPAVCLQEAARLMSGRRYSESIIHAVAHAAPPPERLEEGASVKRRPVKEAGCLGDPYVDLLA